MEKRRASMDTKQRQRAVIEFLLLEGRPGDEIAIRLHNVYEEKYILTVFWNPGGFQVVTILLTGASFNATSFINGNLVPL
jgi:hypothetical protein